MARLEALTVEQEYQQLRPLLNEPQWRQYLAAEAQRRGSISLVAREARVSLNTVKRGLRERAAGAHYQAGGRIRKPGAGRKKVTVTDATLLADLEQEVDPRGDPMSLVQWTTKSLAHLTTALQAKGHRIHKSALATILHERGFSLRINKKTFEGTAPPDRGAQFEHIRSTCTAFEQQGAPIISADCKKKELIGAFTNNGREWQAKGTDTCVNVYDFRSLADGKAVPYGVYDLVHKQGLVNVGIDHDTAAFAVESIRRWWRSCGKQLYPTARQLLITADSGGSNGARNRLWKRELQGLADAEQLTITVAHYPPATSKWNKIEHRLFAFISINWRAKPLTSLEVVLELLSHTTTAAGLSITAITDTNTYPTGIRVTDDELAALHLLPDVFHGEWNYTIAPHTT
ncbi:MAG: ISAzo13 family transposase [Dehalococcoidia bacterium]